MKTILFIASRFPYPVTNGRDKTLVEYLSFFKNQDVKLVFGFIGKSIIEPNQISALQEHIGVNFEHIEFLQLPKLQSIAGSVLIKSFLVQKSSMQEALFYSKEIQAKLDKLTKEYKPDAIFCDMLRTAQYFNNPSKLNKNTLQIFDMDDILSNRYKYLLEHDNNNILGNFAANLPNFVNTLANTVLKKFILNLEAKLVKKSEIRLANTFDKVILVSPLETEKLKKDIKNQSVYYLYPSSSYGNITAKPEKEPFSISFMGLLNVPHNEYSLIHFLEKVFPDLITRIPQLKLYIIGGGATKKLLQYGEIYPKNIIFTGYVKDYTSYLLKTTVFVAPINFGTGIKLKILDAMGLGLPIVTTSMGAEGLMVRDNVDIFIRNDSESYANAIVELLNSKQLAEEIGSNALNYVKNYHDYNQLQKRFLDILELK